MHLIKRVVNEENCCKRWQRCVFAATRVPLHPSLPHQLLSFLLLPIHRKRSFFQSSTSKKRHFRSFPRQESNFDPKIKKHTNTKMQKDMTFSNVTVTFLKKDWTPFLSSCGSTARSRPPSPSSASGRVIFRYAILFCLIHVTTIFLIWDETSSKDRTFFLICFINLIMSHTDANNLTLMKGTE